LPLATVGGCARLGARYTRSALAGDRYVAILERAFPGSAAAATGRYLRTTWSRALPY